MVMYIERRYELRAPAKNRTLKKRLRFRLVALARLAFLHHFPVVVNAARLLDGPLVSRIGLSDRLAKILSGEE
jgi:hypothetical protein